MEALLFLTPVPLSAREIGELVGVTEEEVLSAISELKKRYADSALIIEESLGGYRMNVREEYAWIGRKLGVLPEFSEWELRVIAELLKEGKVPLSRIKKRKGWKDFVEKLVHLGGAVVRKEGKRELLVKTPYLERYFRVRERPSSPPQRGEEISEG